MKRIIFILSLLTAGVTMALAQAGTPKWYLDSQDGIFTVTISRDTAATAAGVATSDTTLYQFVPPASGCYYRGMVVTEKSGGVGTVRFALATAWGTAPALDSTITTTAGIGTNPIFIGVGETTTTPLKTAMTPATKYWLGIVYTSGAVFTKFNCQLYFSLR